MDLIEELTLKIFPLFASMERNGEKENNFLSLVWLMIKILTSKISCLYSSRELGEGTIEELVSIELHDHVSV